MPCLIWSDLQIQLIHEYCLIYLDWPLCIRLVWLCHHKMVYSFFLSRKRFTYFVWKVFARWKLPSGKFRLFGPLVKTNMLEPKGKTRLKEIRVNSGFIIYNQTKKRGENSQKGKGWVHRNWQPNFLSPLSQSRLPSTQSFSAKTHFRPAGHIQYFLIFLKTPKNIVPGWRCKEFRL